uniref:Uncharacterized protein n=1 Tax=Magallana gigas TaxID=29159 RepID=A0A8W8MIS8_MAGGI
MGFLLLMSQICTAMVLNAYAMSWFDFQNKCRLLGQEMPSATHHQKPYWTKYYKRQSDWIGKYEKDGPKIICSDSNANCNHKEDQIQIYKDETKCNSVIENYREKCNINLTTQVYTSFDRGKELSISFKTNILFCQQCTEKRCSFKKCTSRINNTNCAQSELSTAHPSVLKSITQTAVPNVTEKRVSLMWITFNKLVSRCTKQTILHGANVSRTTQPTPKENAITNSRYMNQTLLHGPSVSRTTQSTSKEDTLSNNSMVFIVGGLASSTVISFLFLMVAIYFIRRKHILIEEKCSTLQKQIECSKFRYEQTSIGKLNPQNKQTNQNVTGTSYYELADNSKLIETYPNNKDNNQPYYEIKEPISGNDTYMVVSYKMLDVESVNFDRKKGSYDHLKKTSRIGHEENTYDHAENINESSYSCLGAAKNWNDRHIDNDMYDHI